RDDQSPRTLPTRTTAEYERGASATWSLIVCATSPPCDAPAATGDWCRPFPLPPSHAILPPMPALLTVAIAGALLLLAYFTYARWLSRRVFQLDDTRPTPGIVLDASCGHTKHRKQEY
ncbi:MAG: hypothetical protein EA380_00765, partial [Phycisphaeraceae bacterium]